MSTRTWTQVRKKTSEASVRPLASVSFVITSPKGLIDTIPLKTAGV